MGKRLSDKLCLGTVQFGIDYGIANTGGKVDKKEVSKILDYAYSQEVFFLDTAHSYGDSEKILGEFVCRGHKYKIISKLPPIGDKDARQIRRLFFESLGNLKQEKIYGYLLHRASDYFSCDGLWQELLCLKMEGLIEKIGFSLYNPSELEDLLERAPQIDIVQVPYSIFDRRFSRYFDKLKAMGIEVHARSVFLQGLVFLAPKDLSVYLIAAKEYLEKLRVISEKESISINAICLNFVLINSGIDKVVIGVDGLDHLIKNIQDIELAPKVSNIIGKFDELRIDNEDIILPYKWGRK